MIATGKLYKKEKLMALLFVAVPITGFLIFTLITMIASISFSFQDYNPVREETKWIGLHNFVQLFTSQNYSQKFVDAIVNTLILSLSVPIGMVVGLVFAGMINNSKLAGKKFFRAALYLPAVCSAVALNIIWRYIFNSEYGIINQVLGVKLYWLSEDSLLRTAIIFKNVINGIGGTMILYSAAMLSVGKDYYEAADIDGAGGLTKFFKITLPLVTPTTFYLLIVGLIGALQSYADSQIFAAGDSGARTIVYFIWQYGIDQSLYGIASAASLILAVSIMIITIIQFRVSKKWVYEE